MKSTDTTDAVGDGAGPELAVFSYSVPLSQSADFYFNPSDSKRQIHSAKGNDVIDRSEVVMRATKLAFQYLTCREHGETRVINSQPQRTLPLRLKTIVGRK